MEGSSPRQHINKTVQVLSERLLLKPKDKDIVRYLSIDHKMINFFDSYAEPMCFLALILFVCIIIFGIKFVYDGNEERTRETNEYQIPKKICKPNDCKNHQNIKVSSLV